MQEITFKDIDNANKALATTDIKGKPYIEVNQRIKAFRMVYPTGNIKTEMVSNENGICIFKAEVLALGCVLGTGHAYEKENSSFINKTSYIENCETSAVGRALGMAGFGIDTSIASFEEVANAIQQQEEDKPISKVQEDALREMITNNGIANEEVISILKNKGYTRLAEIKIKHYSNIVNEFQKLIGG